MVLRRFSSGSPSESIALINGNANFYERHLRSAVEWIAGVSGFFRILRSRRRRWVAK